ncbi:sigma-70 family RNA polymerase sigma factor, partial [Streptococcus gordonii]|nr:sigma-70 family RNA polymerase sigma factor [Streptococcus gordonii]
MKFEEVYKQVEGIVKRCYKDYYLHLWEYADWRQEGMLVLYE